MKPLGEAAMPPPLEAELPATVQLSRSHSYAPPPTAVGARLLMIRQLLRVDP